MEHKQQRKQKWAFSIPGSCCRERRTSSTSLKKSSYVHFFFSPSREDSRSSCRMVPVWGLVWDAGFSGRLRLLWIPFRGTSINHHSWYPTQVSCCELSPKATKCLKTVREPALPFLFHYCFISYHVSNSDQQELFWWDMPCLHPRAVVWWSITLWFTFSFCELSLLLITRYCSARVTSGLV